VRYLPIILAIVLSSCNPCERLVNKYNRLETRQEKVEEKLQIEMCQFTPLKEIEIVTTRDTIYELELIEIEVPPRVIRDTFEVECDENNKAQLETVKSSKGGVSLETKVVDGRLEISATCDSLTKVIEVLQRTVNNTKTISENKQKILKAQTDKWKLVAYTLGILLLFAIVFTIFRMTR